MKELSDHEFMNVETDEAIGRIRDAAPAMLTALEMVRDYDDLCVRRGKSCLDLLTAASVNGAIAAARGVKK